MQTHWNWMKNENQTPSHNFGRSTNNLPAAASYFGPLASFYQDMDRMFEQTFRNLGMPTFFGSLRGMFKPTMDIVSTDKEYTVEVEAPGMSEDDIRIDLMPDGQLCIGGEKRQENDNQEKDFHRVERSYGSFSRTLSLPKDVDQENIQAKFHKGILTITIPRLATKNSPARRIEIDGDRQRSRQEMPRQENAANSNPKRVA